MGGKGSGRKPQEPETSKPESKTDEVKEFLADKKLEVTTLEPKKVETRGRPKKVAKPTYDYKKYSQEPIAKTINKALSEMFNRTVLQKKEKIKPEELEIGESLMFCIDYYGASILLHPIWMVLSAFIGLGVTVVEKQPIAKTTESKEMFTGEPRG